MTRSAPLMCLYLAGDEISVRFDPPFFASAPHSGVYAYETHLTGGAGWGRIGWHIFRTILLARPDVVVSGEYRRAFLVNLALLLTLSRAPHVVLGMNLSAKPIVSRNRLVQRAINRVFGRSTAIVVHSTTEADIFSRLHDLPRDRFAFSHWGFDLPEEGTRFDHEAKPYFCMIGRNNRDFNTFAAALGLAGARGIAILPGYLELDPEVGQAVTVYRDLPMEDCVNCIRNASANVTLLLDDSRGAGHITVVTAMHLGVPQIYSRTEVLGDYFCRPEFGEAVPIRDPARVAQAMRDVLERASQPGSDDLVAARKAFAQRWLSNDRSARRIFDVIQAAHEGRRIALVDPAWDQWLQGEAARAETRNP